MEYEVLVISHQNVFNIYFTVDGALCSIRYSPLSSALALVQHDPVDDTYVLNVFRLLLAHAMNLANRQFQGLRRINSSVLLFPWCYADRGALCYDGTIIRETVKSVPRIIVFCRNAFRFLLFCYSDRGRGYLMDVQTWITLFLFTARHEVFFCLTLKSLSIMKVEYEERT